MTPVPFGKRYTKNDDGKGTYGMSPGTEVLVVGYYAPTDNQGDDWVSVIHAHAEAYNVEPKTFRRWHLEESYTPVSDKWAVGKTYVYADEGTVRWTCKFVDTDGFAYMRSLHSRAGVGFTAAERSGYREVTD